jgi:glycosyltransferase involved in cell wall biosynthesis
VARIAAVVSNGCAPDPRVIRQAKWCTEQGHEVVIHAFDRRENLSVDEVIDGVRIIRHRVGFVPYGGTWSTWRGLRRFLASVADSIGPVDLLHCHDADTLPLAKSMTDTPVLFDMHDLHHTWVLMPAPNSPIRRIISSRMKGNMLRRAKAASSIITSSQGFSEWLRERDLNSVVVENRPQKAESPSFPERLTIGYFGRIREVESFKFLFKAVLQIAETERPRIIIAGDGTKSKEVQRLASSHTELDVNVRDSFTHAELPNLMSEISVMYAMYSSERGNINDGALPAKMFEAAAHGRPTIVNANTPMGAVCESEGLGVTVDWGDSQALALAITGSQGTQVTLEIDESRERERFLSVLDQLKI